MNGHHTHSFVEIVKHTLEKLPPLSERKNPLLSGILGFLFGPFGTAIYFGSFLDFFIGVGMIFLLFLFIPGIGIIPGWIFNAVFAYFRAETSNHRNRYY